MNTLRPLLAYLPWHARDAVVRALVPPLLFFVIVGGPLYAFRQANPHLTYDDGGSGAAFALNIYVSFVQMAMTLGAIAMMNQLVALDRERQFVRFLFPQPVVPWQFYLQRYLVSLVLFVAVFASIPLLYSWWVSPVPLVPALQSAALYGLLFGGLSILCGALVQRDGVALIGVLIASTVLQQIAATDGAPGAVTFFSRILPPFRMAGGIRAEWLAGAPVETGDLLHVLGYAVAMLTVGLVVVKRFPLVR